MSNDYPPKLEVPVTQSLTNPQLIDVKLMFPSPKEIEGKFGTQYLYGVEYNGVQHSLFASNALHRAIQDTGATENTVVKLGRVGTGTDTRWSAEYVSGPQASNDPQPQQDQQPQQTQQPAPQQQQTVQKTPPQPQHPVHGKSAGFVYEPLTNYELIQLMADDNAAVYAICYETMRKSVPTDEEGNPKWSEERIGNAASTIFIALQHATRSLTGRTIFSELNRYENGPVQHGNGGSSQEDNSFREWFSTLTDLEKEAYKATSESEYLDVVMRAAPRYGNNSFGAKGAVMKFTDTIPVEADRNAGKERILLLRRTVAYAEARNNSLDSNAAVIKAIEKVASL